MNMAGFCFVRGCKHLGKIQIETARGNFAFCDEHAAEAIKRKINNKLAELGDQFERIRLEQIDAFRSIGNRAED